MLAVPLARNSEARRRAHSYELVGQEGGGITIGHYVPSEVELDALAARARPMLLEADRCSYKTGLAALRRLIMKSGHPDAVGYAEAVGDLKAGWDELRAAGTARYFLVERDDNDRRIGSWRDAELADGHLNGDLVHADEGKQHLSDRRQRAMASWARHAEICDLAETSVAFGKTLNTELALGLPSWTFDTADLEAGVVRLPGAGYLLDGDASLEALQDMAAAVPGTHPGPLAEDVVLGPGEVTWFRALPSAVEILGPARR